MADDKNKYDIIPKDRFPKEGLLDGMQSIRKVRVSVPPPSPEQASGLNFVLHALRRQWKWALPLGILLGSTAATIVFLLFKPSYEAVAWLKIQARPQYIAFESNTEDRESSRIFVQTQIELLRSPLVLSPALAESEIARMPEIAGQTDPIKWLSKKIAIKAVGESELYRIIYASSDPQSSAKVINTILDEYFQLRGHEETGRTEQVIRILEQEREKRIRELTLMRKTVENLAKQAGRTAFMGGGESTVVFNNPLADLQNHLVNAEVEQEVLKAKIKAFEESPAQEDLISEAVIENKINIHPEVQRMKQDLSAMRAQLRNLESVSVRKADRQQLTKEIGDTETAFQQLRKDLRSQIKVEIQSTAAAKRDEQIAALRTDLESRRIAAEMLRERCENQIKSEKQTSGETLQLQFKQGELQRAEKIYDLISERIVRLRTEIGAPERVVCMHRADPPSAPIETFPLNNILFAALAGFALPFGLALGVEKMIHRVGDAANLETVSHLPVVGEIARLPARRRIDRRHASLQLGLDLRMFEESVNSLRTTLMLAEELRDLRVMAVTSATTHEGKTSVAVQLAMSVARATQQPTLLIDGDMRSPNLHDIFGTKLEPGLTKVLAGEASIDEAIVTTSCPSLDLLPAGVLTSNPHRLLGNSNSADLLKSLPQKYRYVLIDTPPVLAASESLMLATMADATLVCVLRDVSRIDQIKKAYKQLSLAGGKPVGLVLNGVPTRTYANYYGTYGLYDR